MQVIMEMVEYQKLNEIKEKYVELNKKFEEIEEWKTYHQEQSLDPLGRPLIAVEVDIEKIKEFILKNVDENVDRVIFKNADTFENKVI